MMDVLLEACPSFRPTWESFLDEWEDSADDLPHYLALADVARHLIGMLEQSEIATFPAIFQAVERLVTEGEHYVAEAAVVGLLEDLQNRNLHTATEPMQFRPFLGPDSVVAWDELYKFWRTGQSSLIKGPRLEPALDPSAQPDSATVEEAELRRMQQWLDRKE